MPVNGSTTARGYGRPHQKLRADYQRRMDRGETFYCPKCGRPVNPRHWDLGHAPGDKTRYLGPQHVGRECPAGGNRDTTNERRTKKRAPRRWRL